MSENKSASANRPVSLKIVILLVVVFVAIAAGIAIAVLVPKNASQDAQGDALPSQSTATTMQDSGFVPVIGEDCRIESAVTLTGEELGNSNTDSERTFAASNMLDGDPLTCWCVNTAETGGAGAEVRFTLNKKTAVCGIRLINGNLYAPADGLYKSNGQVEKFTLTFSDGSTVSLKAALNSNAATDYQYFYFEQAIETDSIVLTVNSGYAGAKYTANVCIAEFGICLQKPEGAQTATTEAPETTTNAPETTTAEVTTEAPTTQEATTVDTSGPKKVGYVVYDTPDDAGVNVRSEASSGSTLLTTLAERTVVYYYPDTLQNGYVYCELTKKQDGVSNGWVLYEYLSDTEPVDSENEYLAYMHFLQSAENQSRLSSARMAVADVNGDGVDELILAGYGGCTEIYTYQSASQQVVAIFSESMGKGVNMTVAYNTARQQVIVPLADTGGSGYTIYKMSGSKATATLEMRYNNGKFTESGNAEFIINGDGVSAEKYEQYTEEIYEGFTVVSYDLDTMLSVIKRYISGS